MDDVSANKTKVAINLLLDGLQNWSQTNKERIEAWQSAYDFMGLSVTISICDKCNDEHFSFEGCDAPKAIIFMVKVKASFPMGKFESEQAMIEQYLDKYKKV